MTDTQSALDHLEAEYDVLKESNAKLLAENDQLRTKLAAMQCHARRLAELAAGMVGVG